MKINYLFANRAIALIDLAIDGLTRIKELIAENKEITDNDWMRSAAPLTELSNLIDTQNIKLNYPTCSQCIFYSKDLSACMYPPNKGIALKNIQDADNTSCDNVTVELQGETE